jgi:DNA end-binding protein Ku
LIQGYFEKKIMRAIWTGAISFGLVNIPVRLYSAVGESSLDFDMLAKKDLSPIRYARIATSDGKEVAWKDIVKGYEIEKGHYVVLDDKDFEKANAQKTKAIEIVDFVLEEEIDPMYFDKPYYLEPDKNAGKPYALLREALKDSKKVGIAKFVLRNREKIAVVKASGNAIILNQLRYHADIRDYSDLNLPAANIISDKEKEMALKLIEQLTEKFAPEQFIDTYTDELMKVIEAKAEGKTIKSSTKEPEATKVKDLMDTLMASLNQSSKGADKGGQKKIEPKETKKPAAVRAPVKRGATADSKIKKK